MIGACSQCGAGYRYREGGTGLCGDCYTAAMQAGFAERRVAAVEDLDWLWRSGESPFLAAKRVWPKAETLQEWCVEQGRDDLAEWLAPVVRARENRKARSRR